MREVHGLNGRVSNKLKLALLVLVAVFTLSGFGAAQASAAQQVDLTFNDAWIKLPALQSLMGSLHAIDSTDGKNVTVSLKGTYDAKTGKVAYKGSEFRFPQQKFDVIGNELRLDIAAVQDFTGTYSAATGAVKVQLPLKLTLDTAGLGGVKCEIRPLNIALDSAGAPVDFLLKDTPPAQSKGGAAFTPLAGAGAVIGSWTDVTVANSVFGIAAYDKTEAAMTQSCKDTVTLILGMGGGTAESSFDGTIWLGGTATLTGTNVSITAAKKVTVKKGKTTTIAVKVKNSGGSVLKGKLGIKSSNKQVKAPKSASLNIAPGKTQTVKVKVKAGKKAKGKAKVTFTAGGKKAVTTITVKK